MRSLDAVFLPFLKLGRFVVTGVTQLLTGLTVTGAGLVVGAPTGGDKGASTVNVATSYYKNGALVGFFGQQVTNWDGALQTPSGTTPDDDTIPQNTEGTQIYSATITPLFATSILVVRALVQCQTSGGTGAILALFRDAGANAVAVGYNQDNGTGTSGRFQVELEYTVVAGSVAATTFALRLGTAGGITVTVNGVSSARKFGGVQLSGLSVTEYIVG